MVLQRSTALNMVIINLLRTTIARTPSWDYNAFLTYFAWWRHRKSSYNRGIMQSVKCLCNASQPWGSSQVFVVLDALAPALLVPSCLSVSLGHAQLLGISQPYAVSVQLSVWSRGSTSLACLAFPHPIPWCISYTSSSPSIDTVVWRFGIPNGLARIIVYRYIFWNMFIIIIIW